MPGSARPQHPEKVGPGGGKCCRNGRPGPRRLRKQSERHRQRPRQRSCVDTSGPNIKVGSLNSLSGTMAISEVTVRDAIKLAVDEINATGGVLGKQIQIVGEDGASDRPCSPQKAEKLIKDDCVAAVFGGWTSSSRKAMLPVFESNNSLLYYPVQYEGLESSKNIFYTGATTNQQIVPGAGLPQGEGRQVALPGRQRLRLPADRQPDHQGLRGGQRHRDQGRGLHPAGLHRLLHHRQQGPRVQAGRGLQHPQRRLQRGVLQGVHQRRPDAAEDAGGLGVDRRGRGQGHRRAEHRRPADRLELLPDARQPGEQGVRRRHSRPSTAQDRVDLGPDGSRLRLGVPVEEHRREGESRSTSRRFRTTPAASPSTHPRAWSPSTARTTTSPRPPASARSIPTA